ncbi:hypothetical protein [[Leptolyngbya] sp. PCC 7376]|uniref:hypothetical protein n=1 Tax=[Leptolyngbya] sp. PCC 7376 TaxID=111781 RepID=UPI0005A11D40|nr:hypothetical protein [[Leptolyngbya] sp. PCC 7376]
MKGTWSFYSARTELYKTWKDQCKIKQLNEKMKSFRVLINPIKTKIRNNGIAHTLINEREYLKSFDRTPILQIICEIGDLMNEGTKMKYTYTCGTYEKIVLREYFDIRNLVDK